MAVYRVRVPDMPSPREPVNAIPRLTGPHTSNRPGGNIKVSRDSLMDSGGNIAAANS